MEKTPEYEKELSKDSITTQVLIVQGNGQVVSRAELESVFKRAAMYSLLLTGTVCILGESGAFVEAVTTGTQMAAVPFPMFFTHYVFSKGFYTFWVACTM